MSQRTLQRLADVLVAFVAATALMFACNGCASLTRTTIVAVSSGIGAGAGLVLAGPPGAAGGAVLAGGVAHAIVEADATSDREKVLVNKLTDTEPSLLEKILEWWWAILLGLWGYTRRAHLVDAVTGNQPRGDAILRALGVRTYKTPRPQKRAT